MTKEVEMQVEQVSEILHRAAETHHVVYGIVDGDDADWATWYSEWLLDLSELPQVLARTPVRSELTWKPVGLDKEYRERAPGEPWETYYARGIVAHFTPDER